MGRPSKYNDALLAKANKYLKDFNHYGAQFPSHIGLGLYLNVTTETMYVWAKEEGKEAFSDTLRKIKDIQHEMLIGKGITGEFNSNITKLALTNHGYSDKQQQEVSGPDGGPQEHKWEVEIKDTTNA